MRGDEWSKHHNIVETSHIVSYIGIVQSMHRRLHNNSDIRILVQTKATKQPELCIGRLKHDVYIASNAPQVTSANQKVERDTMRSNVIDGLHTCRCREERLSWAAVPLLPGRFSSLRTAHRSVAKRTHNEQNGWMMSIFKNELFQECTHECIDQCVWCVINCRLMIAVPCFSANL